jgi:hypothetical protein
LSYNGFSYRFRYASAEELGVAEAHGFVPAAVLPSLPDVHKTYESPRLFSAFAHRLPDSKRPDYPHVLELFGLTRKSDLFDILRETRGRLATDQFSFEEAPIVTESGGLITCWIAGWRFHQGDRVLSQLHPGTPLQLRRDTGNPHDQHAVVVSTVNGAKLGYVPVFHSDFVFGELSKGRDVKASIVELRLPPAEPSQRARIKIEISFGEDEGEVRNQIRSKLRSGDLPRSMPQPLLGGTLEGNEPIVIGSGVGRVCSACGRTIDDPKMLSVEFKYPALGAVYFHYRCFELWRELRSEPRHTSVGD